MTHLIVGLGNPGDKYKENRHNAGFILLEYLISELTGSRVNELKFDSKLDANTLQITVKGLKYIFAEPQTYMNASGTAVQKILNYYKIPVENLTVIHDDLDIKLGEYKIQRGSGPKQHNGISSIEDSLGTRDYNRVRVGIENRPEDLKISGEDYVLSNFRPDEKEVFSKEVFPEIAKDLDFLS